MKRILAYVPDLMDRSRITAATGSNVVFVPSPRALAERGVEGDLALVDLSRPGVVEQLAGISMPTIGFASHVDRELMAAARAAGCDQVLARSAFFGRLRELVA